MKTAWMPLAVFYLLGINVAYAVGQPLNQPSIWGTDEERLLILQKVKKYAWARNVVE